MKVPSLCPSLRPSVGHTSTKMERSANRVTSASISKVDIDIFAYMRICFFMQALIFICVRSVGRNLRVYLVLKNAHKAVPIIPIVKFASKIIVIIGTQADRVKDSYEGLNCVEVDYVRTDWRDIFFYDQICHFNLSPMAAH